MDLAIPCLLLHIFRDTITLMLGNNGRVCSYKAAVTFGTSQLTGTRGETCIYEGAHSPEGLLGPVTCKYRNMSQERKSRTLQQTGADGLVVVEMEHQDRTGGDL